MGEQGAALRGRLRGLLARGDNSTVRVCMRKTRPSATRAEYLAAFTEGAQAVGFNVVTMREVNQFTSARKWADKAREMACDFGVAWALSERMIAGFARLGADVVVVELPFFREPFQRHHYCSLAFGGLNGYGINFFAANRSDDRLRRVFEPGLRIHPMRRGSGNGNGSGGVVGVRQDQPPVVLVVGQMYFDRSMFPIIRRYGRPRMWYTRAVTHINAALPSAKVVFRPHPQDVLHAGWAPAGAVLQDGRVTTFEEAVASAWVVVTMNSNAAVDALLMGVPVVAVDPGSMAWPIASRTLAEVADPYVPTEALRRQWLAAMAYGQWSLDELRSGVAWQVGASVPYVLLIHWLLFGWFTLHQNTMRF